MDVDAGMGSADRWRNIDDVLAEANRVVIEHDPSVLEAEELVQGLSLGPFHPGCLGQLRTHYEAPVMPRKKAVKDLIGLLTVGSAGQTELTGQPVLEGSPQPLDAAFGLRRESVDQLNPEFVE